MQPIHIIKRDGKRTSESFDPAKLSQSIRAACLSVRSPEGEADMIAERVLQTVVSWLSARPEVTSHDLRRKATETLMIHHPEAAYLYKHHRYVI